MEKLIRNGMVGVLYSPGFGAGWSTWYSYALDEDGKGIDISEQLLMRKDLVQAVLDENWEYLVEQFEDLTDREQYIPRPVTDDPFELEVGWVPVGAKFLVTEYDGNEGIILLENQNYFEA